MNFSDGIVMNRKDWEFEYTAKTLADAASSKKAYRESRVEWWKNQQSSLMAEIKENGLEINESVASLYATSASRAPQLTVKADLQQKLSECHAKIREHLEAVREYDGWVQVLNANPESRLKLKYGDWLFFFGED
jgi:hypothetical protein